MATETPIGIEDHVGTSETGDALTAVDGTAQTAAAGHPIANLATDDPGETWRSAGLTQDETSLLWTANAEEPRLLGGSTLPHHNLSQAAILQVIADPYWAARRTLNLNGSGESATFASQSSHAEVTYLCRCRIRPFRATVVAVTDHLWWFGSAFSGPTLDAYITFTAAGYLEARITRYSGSVALITDTVRRDDGVTWWDIVLRISDAGGPTAELLVNEASIGTATPPAYSSQTSQTLTLAGGATHADVSEVSIFSRDLSTAADRTMAWNATGIESDCALLSRVAGATTVLDVLAGTAGATSGSPDRTGVIYNPSAGADSGALEPHGPWQSRQAVRISAGAIQQSTTTDTPRSMALSLSFRGDQAAVITQGAFFVALFGDHAGADIRMSVTGAGEFAITCRGSSHTATGYLDGSWHRLSLSMDGNDDTAEIWLDGASAASLTGITPYVNGTILRRHISYDGTGGWLEFSDVRFYTAPRTLASIDTFTPPAPWLDPHLDLHWPLDGVTTNVVDGAAPTSDTSTKTWVNRTRTDAVDFRPGSAAGVQGYASPLTAAVDATSDFWTATLSAEAALVIWDPLNSDGYVELGAWHLWSTVSPTISRALGRTFKRRAPALLRSHANVARSELGAKTDVVTFKLDGLSETEALALMQRLLRRRGRGRPIVVFTDTQSSDRGHRGLLDVYGYLDGEPTLEEWGPLGDHRVTIAVARKEVVRVRP